MEEKESKEENKIKDIYNNNLEENNSQKNKTLKETIKIKNKIQSQLLIKEYGNKGIPKNKYDSNNINYTSFDVSGKRFITEREEQKNNPNQLNKDENQKKLQNLKTDNKNIDIIENNNIHEVKKQRKIFIDLNIENKGIIIDNKEDIIESQKKKYRNNSIRTCQYTLLTFLPLAIFNQFKTAFNWFFLFSFILVCIPQISDISPLAEAPPFAIVMIISLVKEAIEDYRKYINDKKSNNAKVLIFKDSKFCIEKCQNIRVGNIIKIHKDELIPADVLVIKSSLKSGLCYMQTSNLDGENVLKPREAFTSIQNTVLNKVNIKEIFEYKDSNFFIEVIPPNKDIYDIEGTVFYENEQNYITIKNVLLRGARLKNVNYIYGIVLYTGHDTKLMQNIGHSSLKMSSIDKKLNYIILIIFIACIIINIISSILGVHFRKKNLPNYKKGEMKAEYLLYYRTEETKTSLEIIRIVTNNFLIYTTFIPISIIISNAFCKIIQTVYLQLFTPEYKLDKDDKIRCFSTGLLDELGMVKYIFSDKTGTLTKNEMIFRGCSIHNQLFDDSIGNIDNNNSITNDSYLAQSILNLPFFQKREVSTPSKKNISLNESTKFASKMMNNSKISESFDIANFLKSIQYNRNSKNIYYGNIPIGNIYEAFEHFFINIIVNHDVLKETNLDDDKINFQGSSPDEITLVSAAFELGFQFVSRENGLIKIEIHNFENGNITKKNFKILQKFDFTSERQCSSIVVEDLQTKKIILYIKGSDKKIFGSLDEFSKGNIFPKTKKHVEQFAKRGLRTLCFGFKYIKKENYKKWEKDYNDTKYKSIQNKELLNDLNKHIKRIENKVFLLGVTALEDKLQNEVEKDIKKFIEAGINFWMITGDKLDTAESIGYSCGIFSEDCEIYKIRDTNDENEVINKMNEISEKINKIDLELNNITKTHQDKMVEKKIIKNDENFRRYRKRCNSFTGNNKKLESFNENRKSKDGKSMNIYGGKKVNIKNQKLQDKIESQQTLKQNLEMNSNKDNNENNQNKESTNNKYEKIAYTLNVQKNEANQRKINLTRLRKNFEGSSSNSQEENKEENNEKNIFKFLTNKVDNDKEYANLSFLKDDVKQFQQSISSIYSENEENQINNSIEMMSNSRLPNIESNNNLGRIELNNENIIKDKRYKDIPSNEKEFIDYFDLCQKELFNMSLEEAKTIKLFKIKYLYPRPENAEYMKKIKTKFSLMLEGSAINTCMKEGKAADLFWNLIQRSRSLICARASPSQKSKIVSFIRHKTDSVTLAIGDGGNDVNMIRTANVGIGIFGKEGYQAAYNSDYAISQFKYLKRLLFNDGRITLARNCYFLYHYFFKNFLFTLVLFWFGINSGFSGGNYYDDMHSMGFNSFVTVIPIAVFEMFDEDFDPNFTSFINESDKLNDQYSKDKTKEQKLLISLLPDIFKEYRDSFPFNLFKFITIFAISIIFSFICYSIPIYSYSNNVYGTIGYQFSYWDCSIATYFSIIFIHYFILFFDTSLFNPGIIIFYIIQLFVSLIYLFIIDQGDKYSDIYNSLSFIIGNFYSIITIIMTCSFCLVFYFIIRRAEVFFGSFIINRIEQRKYQRIIRRKFYLKKLDQMTRVVRNYSKFKRFLYGNIEEDKVDNLADQKISNYVNDYHIYQIRRSTLGRKSKSYIAKK